jgi:hypothetical protein
MGTSVGKVILEVLWWMLGWSGWRTGRWNHREGPRSFVILLDVGCYVEVTKLLEWAKDIMHEEVEILAAA